MTGCFAETAPGARASVPRGGPLARDPDSVRLCRACSAPGRGRAFSIRGPDRCRGRPAAGAQRVFLKIQDGCDAACAYCVVPMARGPAGPCRGGRVLERAVRAERDGAREIVLTGIRAGRYGADRFDRDGLPGLIEALLDATSGCRFRLGSGRAPGDHLGARFAPLHARTSLPAPARSAAERLRPGAASDAAAVYGEAVS